MSGIEYWIVFNIVILVILWALYYLFLRELSDYLVLSDYKIDFDKNQNKIERIKKQLGELRKVQINRDNWDAHLRKVNNLKKWDTLMEKSIYIWLFIFLMNFVYHALDYEFKIGDTNLLSIILTLMLVLFVLCLLLHFILLAVRYKNGENYISQLYCSLNNDNCNFDVLKDSSKDKKSITVTGNVIVDKINPDWENNLYGFVYFGAAFLVIVVGLRGLGEQIHKIQVIESINSMLFNAILEPKGVKVGIIFIALIFEFSMLCTLALTKFFAPEEEGEEAKKTNRLLHEISDALKTKDGAMPQGTKPIISNEEITALQNQIDLLNSKITGMDLTKILALNSLFTSGFGVSGSALKGELSEIETKLQNIKAIQDTLISNKNELKGVKSMLTDIRNVFSKKTH